MTAKHGHGSSTIGLRCSRHGCARQYELTLDDLPFQDLVAQVEWPTLATPSPRKAAGIRLLVGFAQSQHSVLDHWFRWA